MKCRISEFVYMSESKEALPAPIPAEWMSQWASADCVCFDVDSTLVTEEAINVSNGVEFEALTVHTRYWLSSVAVDRR